MVSHLLSSGPVLAADYSKLLSRQRYCEMHAACLCEQTGEFMLHLGSHHTIIEAQLRCIGKKFGAFFFCQVELFGKRHVTLGERVFFAVAGRSQERPNERLEVGNSAPMYESVGTRILQTNNEL